MKDVANRIRKISSYLSNNERPSKSYFLNEVINIINSISTNKVLTASSKNVMILIDNDLRVIEFSFERNMYESILPKIEHLNYDLENESVVFEYPIPDKMRDIKELFYLIEDNGINVEFYDYPGVFTPSKAYKYIDNVKDVMV